jgi:hypothetical protein
MAGRMIDANTVIARLTEATSTVLAMPGGMPRLGVKVCDYGYSTEFFSLDGEAADDKPSARLLGGVGKPPAPSAASITRADETLKWLSLIPQEKFVLRRIVALRSIVKWTTGKPTYTWRKIGDAVGADHKAIQRWHAQGIKIIVDALNNKG